MAISKKKKIKKLEDMRNECFDDEGEEIFPSLISEIDVLLDELER